VGEGRGARPGGRNAHGYLRAEFLPLDVPRAPQPWTVSLRGLRAHPGAAGSCDCLPQMNRQI